MIVPVGFPKLPPEFEYDTEIHESLDHEHAIFFNIYKKKNITPKRALLIVHGQGEHGGRYQHFPHYLKDTYDLIIAPDLRGHGRSEGIRGHVKNFDEYVDDVLLAWEVLGERLPAGATRDWFGHSMGGTITLRTLLYRPELEARHVIISSPALDLKVHVPVVKEVAAQLLAKVWGSLQMDTGLDASKVSHDPNVVDAYQRDRLNHSKATPQFYLGFKAAMEQLRESDLRFQSSTRVLIQAAGEDEIVDTAATEAFCQKLAHENKEFICYPGLYHEIYNEPTKEHIFEDWVKWLGTNKNE